MFFSNRTFLAVLLATCFFAKAPEAKALEAKALEAKALEAKEAEAKPRRSCGRLLSVSPLYAKARLAYPDLSPEERKALFLEYRKTKDRAIREKLFLHHLSLIEKLASRVRTQGLLQDQDKLQLAAIGLYNAIAGYNPALDVEFQEYATFYVIREIIGNGVRKENLIRLKGHNGYQVLRWLRAHQIELTEENIENGRLRETVPEVSKVSTAELKAIWRLLRVFERKVAYDEISPLYADGESAFEALASREELDQFRLKLHETLLALDPRDRFILEKTVLANEGDEMSYEKLGEMLKISRVRVSFLAKRALARLERKMRAASSWKDPRDRKIRKDQ